MSHYQQQLLFSPSPLSWSISVYEGQMKIGQGFPTAAEWQGYSPPLLSLAHHGAIYLPLESPLSFSLQRRHLLL